MKKEKGPAPPPPQLPNSVASPTRPKETTEGKIATETNVEESVKKPNKKEITEPPTSKTPADTPNQSEVIDIWSNFLLRVSYLIWSSIQIV